MPRAKPKSQTNNNAEVFGNTSAIGKEREREGGDSRQWDGTDGQLLRQVPENRERVRG